MATFIGTANGVDTATLPSHQAGDLIVAWAYRDNSATAPSLPAGQNWTSVQSGGGVTNAGRLAAKIAASSAEGVGTFTNARNTTVAIYRPGTGEALSIGTSAQAGGTSDPVAWSTLTLAAATSWVIGVAGHRNVDTALGTPFTGMTNRSNDIDVNSFTECAVHDTNGGVSSWSSGSTNVGGTASGYRTAVLEMVVTSGGTTHNGALAIAGAGSIAAAAILTAAGSTVFAGLATQSAQATTTQPAAFAASGSAALSTAASLQQPGALAASGSGTLAADGRRQQPGALAASGSADVSATPTMQMNASLAPAVTGTGTTFAASITFGGAAAFGGSSAFSASGESTTPEPEDDGAGILLLRRRRRM